MRRAPSRTHPGRAQLTALTAFTVGRRTAEAARAVGFRDVRSADGDKGDLVDLLRADLVRADLLRGSCAYSPATARRCFISPARTAPAISPPPACPCTPRWSIARSRPMHFPPPVAAALAQGAIDGVLHFSARSAEAYLDCAARGGIGNRRLRRCIIVSRARWRRRCPPPAPLRCGLRPAPTRRRCWSLWERGDGGVSRASAASALARAERRRSGPARDRRLMCASRVSPTCVDPARDSRSAILQGFSPELLGPGSSLALCARSSGTRKTRG